MLRKFEYHPLQILSANVIKNSELVGFPFSLSGIINLSNASRSGQDNQIFSIKCLIDLSTLGAVTTRSLLFSANLLLQIFATDGYNSFVIDTLLLCCTR